MRDAELGLGPPPVPAVPLEYFDRQIGPWVAVARLMAWVGIAYSGIVIVSELAWALEFEFDRSGYGSSETAMVSGFLLAIDAIGLMIGSVLLLQRSRTGRTVLLASSAGAVACVVLSFIITLSLTMFRFGRSYPPIWQILLQQVISGLSLALHRSLVPVLLWIVFGKPAVREVFDAS